MLHSRMAEDSSIRLANLRRLWDKNAWTPTLLAKRCGGRVSLWSDLYHGRKSFGEKLARKIEAGMGLVRLSLDESEGATAQPLSSELMQHLATLDASQALKIENSVRSILGLGLLQSGTPLRRKTDADLQESILNLKHPEVAPGLKRRAGDSHEQQVKRNRRAIR